MPQGWLGPRVEPGRDIRGIAEALEILAVESLQPRDRALVAKKWQRLASGIGAVLISADNRGVAVWEKMRHDARQLLVHVLQPAQKVGGHMVGKCVDRLRAPMRVVRGRRLGGDTLDEAVEIKRRARVASVPVRESGPDLVPARSNLVEIGGNDPNVGIAHEGENERVRGPRGVVDAVSEWRVFQRMNVVGRAAAHRLPKACLDGAAPGLRVV